MGDSSAILALPKNECQFSLAVTGEVAYPPAGTHEI
jgi:hypothetical protein